MKKTITKYQKLEIIGLITVASKYYRIVRQCEAALCDILKMPDEYAEQLSDAIYEDDYNIDSILKNMGVTVK